MRILNYDARHGVLKALPEDVDDLWVLYNVIHPKDVIYARTSREIKKDDEGSRPSEGKRVSLNIGLRVDKVSFQSESTRIRVGGSIIEAPEKYGLLGDHHTVNIELNQDITIVKQVWQKYDLDRVEKATQERGPALLIVALDDEQGAVAILRQHGIITKGEIRSHLPGKLEYDKREKASNDYYGALLQILSEVWNQTHGLIAIVGPGFWKEVFASYIQQHRHDLHANLVTVAMASTGGTAGIEEALRSGVLKKIAEKSRVIVETELVDKVMARLGNQQGEVSYGFEGVGKATSFGAVEEILVADQFLRESEDEERRRIEDLLREVEKMGGRVSVISVEHEGGRKLMGFGGVAALLRFRIE
jgi:protein pelota